MSRVLLRNLAISQLVRKSPALYVSRMSIDAFAGALHFCLSWARQNQAQPPFSFLKIHFHTLPSTPRSSKWSLFSHFPHLTPIFTSPSLHTCHIPRPTHSPWFDHLNTVWWRVKITKFHLTLSPLPSYLLRLRPYSRIPSAYVLPQRKKDQVSHPYKITGNIVILCF